MCREFAETVSELWRTIGQAFDGYRSELYYMRGPARNGALSKRAWSPRQRSDRDSFARHVHRARELAAGGANGE